MMKKIAEKMKKMWQRSAEKYEPLEGWAQVMRIFFGQYDILLANFGRFVQSGIVFMVVYALLILSGKFFAGYVGENYIFAICLMVAVMLLFLAVSAVYMTKWYNIAFKNEDVFNFRINLPIAAKVFGLLLGLFLIMLLPLLSFVMLYQRVVTPDWVFELLYFTFYVALAMLPVFSMRYLSVFAIVMNNEKLPLFSELTAMTRNKLRMIWFSLSFLFVIVLLIWLPAAGINGLFGAFLNLFLIIFAWALFVNHCQVQKEQFIKIEKKQKSS